MAFVAVCFKRFVVDEVFLNRVLLLFLRSPPPPHLPDISMCHTTCVPRRRRAGELGEVHGETGRGRDPEIDRDHRRFEPAELDP